MWGWLPKVYYDLMARLIPGSAIVLGAVYLEDGPYRGIGFVMRGICDPDYVWACRVGIGLLAAYLIGLIIGEVGDLVAGRMMERRDLEVEAGIVRECLDEHNRAAAVTGTPVLNVQPDAMPSVEMMGQQLAFADRYASGRVLALRAERRLCLVLVLGLFLLAFFNLLLYTADLVPKRLVVEAMMVLAIFVLWRRSTRLHERTVRQTCIAWFLNAGGRTAA